MGLSATQRFLVKANLSTGTGEYFRWQNVGHSLGFTDAEADVAVRSLDQRKLAILLQNGDARILAAGRAMASRLESKAQ